MGRLPNRNHSPEAGGRRPRSRSRCPQAASGRELWGRLSRPPPSFGGLPVVFGVRWPVDASPRSGPTFLWLLCVGVCGQVPSLCGRPLCRAAAAPLQCDLIAANRTSTTPVSDRAPLSRRGLGLQHVHFGETLIHAPSWGALRVARRTSWGPHPASLPLPAGLGGRPVLPPQGLCTGRPPPGPPPSSSRPHLSTSAQLPSGKRGRPRHPVRSGSHAPALRPRPTPRFSSLIVFILWQRDTRYVRFTIFTIFKCVHRPVACGTSTRLCGRHSQPSRNSSSPQTDTAPLKHRLATRLPRPLVAAFSSLSLAVTALGPSWGAPEGQGFLPF